VAEFVEAHSPTDNDAGVLYALSNSHMPGLLKIGRTSRAPEARARELGTTGVPGRFCVEWHSQRLLGVADAERAAHTALAENRVKGGEFFRISLPEALHILQPIEARFLDHVVAAERERAARVRKEQRALREQGLARQRQVSAVAIAQFNAWLGDPAVVTAKAEAHDPSDVWGTGSTSGKLGCLVSVVVVAIWSVALLGPGGLVLAAALALVGVPLFERRCSNLRASCWRPVQPRTPEPIWSLLEASDWRLDDRFAQRLADNALQEDGRGRVEDPGASGPKPST
jgi:T5orf172 domain-containing protein